MPVLIAWYHSHSIIIVYHCLDNKTQKLDIKIEKHRDFINIFLFSVEDKFIGSYNSWSTF